MAPNSHITFPCIEVNQPIGTFYVGVMDSKDVEEISYADIRRIETPSQKREIEVVSGIQRPLSDQRVQELKQYVQTIDASFPTSIILAVKSSDATYNEKQRMMTISRKENVALIIDGQHRIKGLEGYKEPWFQLNITIFINMDPEDQALLFATINLKQTKVSKSLAYDLFDFAKGRSPQKTCHNIAKLLNTEESSPFKDRIKILGRATGKPHETLTQAAFIDRLMPYVSRNPMEDRDQLKRGKKLNLATKTEEEKQDLIFRNMFIKKRDAEIARILWNYFGAIARRWPEAWPAKQEGNVLNRTTGFAALMRFLPLAYRSIAEPGVVSKTSDFKKIFDRVKLKDADFTPERYKPGSSGLGDLYRDLVKQSGVG